MQMNNKLTNIKNFFNLKNIKENIIISKVNNKILPSFFNALYYHFQINDLIFNKLKVIVNKIYIHSNK